MILYKQLLYIITEYTQLFTSEYNQPQMIKRKVNDVDDDDGIHISYSSTVYKCVRIKKAVHRKRIKKKKQFQIKKHPISKKKPDNFLFSFSFHRLIKFLFSF